jgi:hypothetical protein
MKALNPAQGKHPFWVLGAAYFGIALRGGMG